MYAVPEPSLSPRELQMITLRARGLSNKQIAEVFTTSEGVIKARFLKARQKMGIDTRALTALVIREEYKGKLRSYGCALAAIPDLPPAVREIAGRMASEVLQ